MDEWFGIDDIIETIEKAAIVSGDPGRVAGFTAGKDSDAESQIDPDECYGKVRATIVEEYQAHFRSGQSFESLHQFFGSDGKLDDSFSHPPVDITDCLKTLTTALEAPSDEFSKSPPKIASFERIVGGFVVLAIKPEWLRNNLGMIRQAALRCAGREMRGDNGRGVPADLLHAMTSLTLGECAKIAAICAEQINRIEISNERLIGDQSHDRRIEMIALLHAATVPAGPSAKDRVLLVARNPDDFRQSILEQLGSAAEEKKPFIACLAENLSAPDELERLLKQNLEDGGLGLSDLFLFRVDTDASSAAFAAPGKILNGLIPLAQRLKRLRATFGTHRPPHPHDRQTKTILSSH